MGAAVTLQGVESLNDHLNGLSAKFRPGGQLEKKVHSISQRVFTYTRKIVHRITGSLFRSVQMQTETWRGHVFLDSSVKNPKSKTLPAEYGHYENARGGSHAFMDRSAEYALRLLNAEIMDILEG